MKAFILVSAREPEKIREYILGVPGVKEAHLVYGGYDLVVIAEVKDLEELGRVVLREIRERFPVDETVTLIVAD